MAKKSKKDNNLSSSFLYLVLGLIILFISLLTLFNWGFFGSLVVNTFRLFVGQAYNLLVIAIASYGLLLIYKRQIYNVSFLKFLGGFVLFTALTLLLHLRDFLPLEPLRENIFQITFDLFKNEFITGQTQLSMGGGMLGALGYWASTDAFGKWGSYILGWSLFIIGLMLVTQITTEHIYKGFVEILNRIGNFFNNVQTTFSKAGESYRDSFEEIPSQEILDLSTDEEENIDSDYQAYTNYEHPEPTTPNKSESLWRKLKTKFNPTRNSHKLDWERDYQLPKYYEINRDWDSYSERDPLARTADQERQRIRYEKNIVLDLDYFDKVKDESSFNHRVAAYQDRDFEELDPTEINDISTDNHIEQEDLNEELEKDNQINNSVNVKVTTHKLKTTNTENSASHWQHQSNKVENTTYDELDEVLKTNNQKNVKQKPKKTKNQKGYQLPTKALLTKIPPVDQSEEYARINENIGKLERTFQSFGVDAKVVKANLGPAVTKYEIEPAIGVKVSKIVSLSDDIALALAARDIRIEAPIPGKSLIGIEVPNLQVSPVSFWEVIDPALKSDNLLEVPLGRDISGSVCLADLSKMPHLLIAGATGSGKSVGMNVIIVSLLMKAKPHEVKFLMIDPKQVELTMYDELPHQLAPVVTNPRKAAQALNNVVQEMERRYELFAAAGTRNIDGYNEYVDKLNQEEETAYERLPKIVVFIDELADLMLVASNDVENAIIRLAQMARAAGIHMIIATQRPSVDVITGIIKANIPSRLAFAVSSGTDSRTILDSVGAEKLLGRGDMLFQPMGRSKPLRVQGAYISDQEVERITDFIKDQSEPDYDEDIMVTEESMEMADASEDEYFQDAVELIKEQETVSISQLQRKFRIGYNRAARLIDDLEAMGFVSEQDGSKPRQVLINN